MPVHRLPDRVRRKLTLNTRAMLFLTALRSRIYDIKFVVSRIDPDAFMVVGISQQTWGGYNAPKFDRR